jgi:hypothetical protein
VKEKNTAQLKAAARNAADNSRQRVEKAIAGMMAPPKSDARAE